MKSWKTNLDAIVPIFKFSNAICRQLNRQRSVFPNDTALLEALFLATDLATKKWTMPLHNRDLIYGELSIIFKGRLPF